MARLLSQIDANRIREKLQTAGLNLITGSLALHDNKVKFSIHENASYGNLAIKTLLEDGIIMKSDDPTMSLSDQMATIENSASDRQNGVGGCDVWIALGNSSGSVFRT